MKSRTSHPKNTLFYFHSRVTTDVGYSSFLLSQKEGREGREEQKKGEGEGEEEEEEEGREGDRADSPSREDYRQGLLTALSRSRGKQKSVLSFKSATPSASSESTILHVIVILLHGNAASYLAESFSEVRGASVCASQTKPTPKSTVLTPTKVMDIPNLKDDFCKGTGIGLALVDCLLIHRFELARLGQEQPVGHRVGRHSVHLGCC